MPAINQNLTIEADSYEPRYWVFLNNITGDLLDLTQAGFVVSGSFATGSQSDDPVLLTLDDTRFQRTATGRVYYAPSSDETLAWAFTNGYYQFYLTHPSGQTVRFGQGRFHVTPKV